MDYGHELEFGVFITPANERPEGVVRLAELAEELGLDLVSFQDHPYQSRFLDTWTLLSYLAARTNRVRLAPNVLNLPLRQPAVIARAAASLDLLSDGRVELGLGAGAFWDAIEAMGGRRLSGGEAVDALEEAIAVIRGIWDTGERGGVRVEGEHYKVRGAARGPAPAHEIGLWIGAYKPRMLRLTGRLGDGWLPSVPYMEPADVAAGNAAIDAAAEQAGRDPRAVRRVLNVSGAYSDGTPGPLSGSAEQQAEELARLALEEGVSVFVATGDDPAEVDRFATEVAPATRELVAAERERRVEEGPSATVTLAGSGADAPSANGASATGAPPQSDEAGAPTSEYERLGVTPTPDDGNRLAAPQWDESTRPHRTPSGPEVSYTDAGRHAGQHLIDVHDHLRNELTQLREVVAQVRDGALGAGEARDALHAMALRQNDWTLGAFCSRYCRVVTQHHTIEDQSVFPHLRGSDSELEPVIDRLTEEHLTIHDAIDAVDRALVHHLEHPDDFDRLQTAIDVLTDTLLSHLSYEEHELVEPLARLGFQPSRL
ncbi:MAG TPA: LLM class flavin-dependent oxidoreductase [Solirubrobacterales bacterium]|nr:LLM class flavin-dependent oxidoreductase [Solirubrobacterales bacterium]